MKEKKFPKIWIQIFLDFDSNRIDVPQHTPFYVLFQNMYFREVYCFGSESQKNYITITVFSI